ncbi:type II secretion system secretin GspD [uncultured Tateyamaria sp.]|uniref:type II secretion system secretin GspD n=1 Tax=uncultured Tateyamaria sp. TaxID=455651 RepID=UPI00261622D1|nr:type II secretion system secretin GspD [uncultured Tateyamaria sp.]
MFRQLAILLLVTALGHPVYAQDVDPTYTINLRQTDITILTEQIADITRRTLIVHPELRGDITVVSAEPLDKEGAWELFQSILRARGFHAIQSGMIWQIVPLEAARAAAQVELGDSTAGSQDFVTRLVPLDNLPAGEAVRVLRPLVAASASIEALENPNAVLITDAAEGAARIQQLARTLDRDQARTSRVLQFRNTQAAIVGAAIADVLGPNPTGARLSVDPGSNTLIIRGTVDELDEVEMLASAMDVPPVSNPQAALSTRVFPLRYGQAEQLAGILTTALTGAGAAATNAVAGDLQQNGLAAAAPVPDTLDVTVAADEAQNAIVARGTEAQLNEVAALLQQLDRKRAQVLIEAAIVEVSGETAQRLSAQLGLGELAPPGGLAATSFSNGGAALGTLLAALGTPNAALATAGGSATIGSGNFGILLQALNQSTNANLLSTPSLMVLDNQPASIVVGQNVPFRTGTFATDGNTVQPFTTIERRDVGLTMNVLPRINDGDTVRLDISQEVSSLVNANVEGAADLITNRRSIETSVLAQSGSTIVLGGLISRDDLKSLQKVPGAGDVPILGNLFKSRSRSSTRRTLFVFLTPTVLRSEQSLAQTYDNRLKALATARSETSTDSGRKQVRRANKPVRLELGGVY